MQLERSGHIEKLSVGAFVGRQIEPVKANRLEKASRAGHWRQLLAPCANHLCFVHRAVQVPALWSEQPCKSRRVGAVDQIRTLWPNGYKTIRRSAGLRGAELCEAGLRGAGLHEAVPCGAGPHRPGLGGAGLRRAGLRGTKLRGAWLRRAGLHREELRGAGLSGPVCASKGWAIRASDLSQSKLHRASKGEASRSASRPKSTARPQES